MISQFLWPLDMFTLHPFRLCSLYYKGGSWAILARDIKLKLNDHLHCKIPTLKTKYLIIGDIKKVFIGERGKYIAIDNQYQLYSSSTDRLKCSIH